MFANIRKLVSKSSYNPKKKEFSITFKDADVAKLVQLLLGSGSQRGKTVKVKVDKDTGTAELLQLLELAS